MGSDLKKYEHLEKRQESHAEQNDMLQEWVWTAAKQHNGTSSSIGCDDIESNDVRPFDVLSRDGVNPRQTVMKMAAPTLLNDYYTNLLSCSADGMIALALGSSVYLWNSEACSLEGHLHPRPPLLTLAQPGRSCHQRQLVSSLCWSGDGRVLSIGTRQGEIQLWDVEQKSKVRCLQSHVAVVGSLSWKQHSLSSGSVLGHIHHHDSRAPKALVGMAVQEGGVCSLEWSPGDQWLASGSTDGLLSIWDSDIAGHTRKHQPVATMKQPSAVKAMGWCPWQRQLVATGGGWRDGDLRIWDIQSGTCMTSAHTNSQICSLLWAEKKRALFTGHGIPHHDITCWTWDFPSLSQSYQLSGHSQRVLHLALSPCGTKIISAGADCCVHIWDFLH